MYTFSLLLVLVLVFFEPSEAGIFSTKKKTWINAVSVASLPPLPAPSVFVQHSKHTITTQENLVAFLGQFVAKPDDLQNLANILMAAWTDERWAMHFWVCCSQNFFRITNFF